MAEVQLGEIRAADSKMPEIDTQFHMSSGDWPGSILGAPPPVEISRESRHILDASCFGYTGVRTPIMVRLVRAVSGRDCSDPKSVRLDVGPICAL